MLETKCVLGGVLVLFATVGLLAIFLRVPILCLGTAWIAAVIIVGAFLRLARLMERPVAFTFSRRIPEPRQPSKSSPTQTPEL